ncbi:hypothetical protein OESDEN_11302 [Oesophagostomum dentatum]|uniref:7TM GPCR serpentine receptor class x (Srx) domain-containing protein n=1 Tax=Oesophagostomum dentatum TaxID=61180 RepID=A0A0B1SU97_OESDE|nr:hypothetical protein OESDEN_11302 [Oesophagostomum dentatum]
MLLINVATFIKLRIVHRSSIRNSGNVANGFDAKRRLEIRFFVQVVLEYIARLYILISYCFISSIFSGQWWHYLTVTLPMPAFHAVDGLILVLVHFRATYQHLKRNSVCVPKRSLAYVREAVRGAGNR